MALKWAYQYRQDKVKTSPTSKLKWAHQYIQEDKTAQAKQIVSASQKPQTPSAWDKIKSGITYGLQKFNAVSDAVLDPFFNQATFGLSKRIEGPKLKQLKEENAKHISPTTRNVLNTVGNVTGTVAGLGGASGIAKATIGKAVAKAGAKGLAKKALTEAGTGAIYEGARAASEGKSLKDTAKVAGKGALLFGVAGPAGEVVGAGAKRTLPRIVNKLSPLAKKSTGEAIGHYTGNALKGVATGAGFSYGGNLLEGNKANHGEAAKNALAFGALDILTGGKYKNIAKDYEMLGEVNKAYERGKLQGAKWAKPEPVVKKEPWQMTRKEFESNYVLHGAGKDMSKLIDTEGKITKGYFTYGNRPDIANQYTANNMLGKSPEGNVYYSNTPIKGNWEITSEATGINPNYPLEISGKVPGGSDPHKYIVEQALSEGKPVPEEVLKDYPDLKVNKLESKPALSKNEQSFLNMIQRTNLTLDDIEKITRERYNNSVDPNEKSVLEGSLSAIGQLRQKLQGKASVSNLEENPQTTLPTQRQSTPISNEIAVNQPRPDNVVYPSKFQAIKGGKKVEKTPPVEPMGTKERGFVSNSALNANVVPETMKQGLKDNMPKYNPISNKDTWNRATQKVSSNIDAAREEYRSIDQLKSADDTALGEALIVDAIKRGDIKAANDLTADLAEKLTSAGQTVQAAAILKRLSPEGMLLYANRIVNKINRQPEIINNIKKKVELTPEESNFIAKTMQKVQTMPEGRAKDIALAKVMQTVSNKVPSNLIDKSRAWRNIALLGNAKTFARNVTGNVLMGTADNVSNTVGSTLLRPLDIYLSKLTGARSTALPSLTKQAKGFIEGGKIAISDALGGITRKDLADKTAWGKLKAIVEGAANPIDTSLSQSGKWEVGRRLAFENKPLRVLENAVNTSLAIGDKPFSQAYYDDVLNQLKKANNTKTVTTEMKQLAQKIAEERTYQDMNTISALAMGIKRLPQKIKNHPKLQSVIQIFVDSLLPYVKTPANILKRGLEYTPEGVIEGLLKLGSFKNAPSLQMQREIIDRISRGLVGTGLMVAGGLAAKKGLATGAPNKDKDVANLEKNIGIQPYSVKVGDYYYNYDWAQPVSMPLGAGVQYAQKSGDSLTAAMDAAASALNYYTDQPMLQSMQRFLGSTNDTKSLGQRTLEAGLELPKQFIPTLLNQAGQYQDQYQREMYSPNFMENALGNPLKGKLPGARETLPTKIDTLGRPVESFQGNNNVFNVFFNPATVTKYKPTPEAQMVLDIFRETGATEQFPRTTQKYIMVGGKKYELTSEEYTNLQKIVGELTRQGFSQVNPNLSTDAKIREMTKIMDYAGKVGRNYIREQRGLPPSK